DRLSPPRRSGRRRASRAGAGVPVARGLPPAGRTRPRGARAAARHRARRRPLVAGHRRRARGRRRPVRDAPRAQARRRDDRHHTQHHGRRSRRRLPVAGTGDELDRLATNLNAMLERIEALMHGLKEVSDNIAHDLKTPLTRLRNRCEEALRLAEDESQYRAALESTIEESEALIRTFNALLMIARAESGQARDGMTEFDAAEIARGVGELYEPLADDKGIRLKVEAPAAAPVHGNRELVSQ